MSLRLTTVLRLLRHRRAAAVPIVVALAAGILFAASAPAGRDKMDKTIAEVRQFEERFNKVYESNDLPAYWEFLADDMTQFWQGGRLDMPEYREFWTKEVASGVRNLEVKTADMAIHVDPSGDSAVAAYRIFVKVQRPDGTIDESWNQETDVMVKKGGRWKIVHMHYSDAPKEKMAGGTQP